MTNRVQAYPILLVLLVFSCFSAKATESQPIAPLADTYVDSNSATSNYGLAEYFEVSDSSNGVSIALLMFDLSEISYDSNVTVEAKLRLCGSATSPYVIGVRLCVNNTWEENTLTFLNFSSFVRTAPESVVTVGAEITWYEWKVTDIVSIAIRENYDKLTLALEAEETVTGDSFAMFFSKDQRQFPPDEASPHLVFTYHDIGAGGVSWNTIAKVTLGVLATSGIIFVAYRFLRKPRKKRTRSFYSK